MDMMMIITHHPRDLYWNVQEIVGGNKSTVGIFVVILTCDCGQSLQERAQGRSA